MIYFYLLLTVALVLLVRRLQTKPGEEARFTPQDFSLEELPVEAAYSLDSLLFHFGETHEEDFLRVVLKGEGRGASPAVSYSFDEESDDLLPLPAALEEYARDLHAVLRDEVEGHWTTLVVMAVFREGFDPVARVFLS